MDVVKGEWKNVAGLIKKINEEFSWSKAWKRYE